MDTMTTKTPTVDAKGTIRILIGGALFFFGLLVAGNPDAQFWFAAALMVAGFITGLFGFIQAVQPRAHATQDRA